MTRVYNDKDLGVSLANFDEPNTLSIELDCDNFIKETIDFDDSEGDEEF